MAAPPTVNLDQRGDRISSRPNHNVLQISGLNILDIQPLKIIGIPYSYNIDAWSLSNLSNFKINFFISGENMKRKIIHINFKLVHIDQ